MGALTLSPAILEVGKLGALGVMSLLWIAALAGFVLLEKIVPQGQKVSRATGLALIAWGALMVAGVIG